MDIPVEEAWKSAQRVEKELHAKLAEKDPTFRDIDYLIEQYRALCENCILTDFAFAQSKNIEGRLWDAHGKINSRFRKLQSRFRGGGDKKKPVEKRKLAKHYLEFIKSSQRFYRSFIQKLSVRYGGIPEIEQVARKFSSNRNSADPESQASPKLKYFILLSCHQTLVRLGDLSRYRETEFTTKNRNWGPAIGYYDLANAIYPASGASHNQLAVIALADGSDLRASYYLYRALAVEEPYPTARGNLELHFKKILKNWASGQPVSAPPNQDDSAARKSLLSWFVRLHAKCYQGKDFAEHDELENEVLSQLAIDLKERSLEGTLQKIILTNIAAEYFAGIRLQQDRDSDEKLQSFFFFLRLNVKTFFTLLQVLEPELERFAGDDAVTSDGHPAITGSERVTAVARRVLPGLRHYSSWIVSSARILVAQGGDASQLGVQIKELWKIYANSLTLLWATFSVDELPKLEYLLEEDEDTIGFRPFDSEEVKGRYFSGGKIKPKWHDEGVERYHPNVEMLARIRDLLIDGLNLQRDDNVPIALADGGRFIYQEEGLSYETPASTNGPRTVSPEATFEQLKTPEDFPKDSPEEVPDDTPQEIAHINGDACTADEEVSLDPQGSESASASISMKMNQMVDSLVGPDTMDQADSNDYQDQKATPDLPRQAPQAPDSAANETTYGPMGTLTARELVNMVHMYSPRSAAQTTPRPALSSIWNSPSHPQQPQSLPRPSTAKTLTSSSPRHLSSSEQPQFGSHHHYNQSQNQNQVNQPTQSFPQPLSSISPPSSLWSTPTRPGPIGAENPVYSHPAGAYHSRHASLYGLGADRSNTSMQSYGNNLAGPGTEYSTLSNAPNSVDHDGMLSPFLFGSPNPWSVGGGSGGSNGGGLTLSMNAADGNTELNGNLNGYGNAFASKRGHGRLSGSYSFAQTPPLNGQGQGQGQGRG